MSATPSGAAAGVLLIVLGVWLLLQTLIGHLVSRVVGAVGGGTGTPITGVGPGPGGSGLPNPSEPNAGPPTAGDLPFTPGPFGPHGKAPL